MNTYGKWLANVDTWCWTLYGLSVHDLSDCPFYDWYDDNVKPKTAARRAAKASGWL